ncbi:TetR/AcrR family transcriptional regulator [Streptomyces sp. NPDC005708]|uniref:TetR/AcrR family transcriptional regulator n=1 Tax=Streptomyces sp. NPDC005708 TaxID=3154564 RepID=UPI0033E42813
MPYVEASARSRQVVAAARRVLARDGVARTSLRAVAAEANVPLGTLQHVFPSKEKLLRAVIEDVVGEIAEVLKSSAELERGLEHAIRQGLTNFWSQLVVGDRNLQIMQYELSTHALRTPGLESLARWQYERYSRIVAAWCQEAAGNAGETCAVPFGRLARVLIASVDGLIIQYVCNPDATRSAEDLEDVITMLVALADVRPAGHGQ